jgi:hypothetical protein
MRALMVFVKGCERSRWQTGKSDGVQAACSYGNVYSFHLALYPELFLNYDSQLE